MCYFLKYFDLLQAHLANVPVNSASWDDWVPQDRIRKNSEENKELAANLKSELDRMLRPHKAAANSTKKKAAGSDLSSARGSEERQTPATGRGQKRGRDYEIEKVRERISSSANRSSSRIRKRRRVNLESTPSLNVTVSSDYASVTSGSVSKARVRSTMASLETREVDGWISSENLRSTPSLEGLCQAEAEPGQVSSFSSDSSPLSSPPSSPRDPDFVEDTTITRKRTAECDHESSSPTKRLRKPKTPAIARAREITKLPSTLTKKDREQYPCGKYDWPPEDLNGPGAHAPLPFGSRIYCEAHIRSGKVYKRNNAGRRGYFGRRTNPAKDFMIAGIPLEETPKDLVRFVKAKRQRVNSTLTGDRKLKWTDLEPIADQDGIIKQEETFNQRPAIHIPIPDHLKSLLVDDWEYVTKNLSLIPLPAEHPVNEILDTYYEEEKARRRFGSADADILQEVVAGIKEYFDKTLGKILLYRFERQQYLEVRQKMDAGRGEWENKAIGDVYGAEHLARLIGEFTIHTVFRRCTFASNTTSCDSTLVAHNSTVSLPELIAQTNMDEQSVRKLREELVKMTTWLGKNSQRFFTAEYEPASQAYIEKARGD